MPAAAKSDEMVRQWEMVLLLPPAGAGVTAKALAEQLAERGYPADVRTIQRDLLKLRDVLQLECNDKSKPYGWRWPSGARAALAGMSTAEALSLRLIEQTVQGLIPRSLLGVLEPRFRQAEAKLRSVAHRNNPARWLDKVASAPRGLSLQPPQYAPEILETVQDALLEEQVLTIRYQSLQDSRPRERVVEPRALLQKGPVTYLVANKQDDTTPILYAIHRIHEAWRTGVPTRRSPFNLRQYLDSQHHEVGTGDWLDLELWVSGNLAKILRETPLAKGQRLTDAPDGALVEVRIRDTLPLRQWLRGHGPALEVLAPAGLRSDMESDLQSAAARYASSARRRRSQAA